MAARSRGDEPPTTTDGKELIGTWKAHGVVKRPVPGFHQPAGTQLEREWTFYERCDATRCQLYLDRETEGETEWSPVYAEDGQLVSASDQAFAPVCAGKPSRLTRKYAISPEGDDALQATEGEYGHDGCPAVPISGLVEWTAERTSDECPAHRGCRDALASQ